MDGADGDGPLTRGEEAGINDILGLFDVPAFARRGFDLEYAHKILHERLRRQREGLLDMVRVRLRQWAAVATGPEDWREIFSIPISPLYELCGAEPPSWSAEPASPRRRRGVARDLAASLERFNRRWMETLKHLHFERINQQIDLYNRYYVLEKECVLGSARLATRNFVPKPHVTVESILSEHPLLPVPKLLV